MKTILLVDDNLTYIEYLKKFLQWNGYHVNIAGTFNEAVMCIKDNPPALICSDFDLQERTGIELLDELNSQNLQIPFIILSCHEKEDYEMEALAHGTTLCLDKMQTSMVRDTLLTYAEKYCRLTEVKVSDSF